MVARVRIDILIRSGGRVRVRVRVRVTPARGNI